MKTKRLFCVLTLVALLPLSTWADVWQDPETKVNYEYTVRKSEARVVISRNVTGDITILSAFTIDDKEYPVTSIGNYAFQSCTRLTSVTIPSSVSTIGYDVFKDCSGLTSIIVESGNTIYDSRDNCNAIIETASNTLILGCKKSLIPSSVTTIGNGAFNGCSGLTSVTIPSSVTTIGSSAFNGCSGLTSVTIPNSVTSIGYQALFRCNGLTSIIVESGNEVYDSREDCNALIETASNTLIQGCSNTIIPSSVSTIGDGAFFGCSGLTSVTIPEGVTTIGEYNQEIKGETNVEIIPVST